MFLSDEIINENQNKIKKIKKRHHKSKIKDYKHFRSESENALIHIKSRKKENKKIKTHKKLSENVVTKFVNRNSLYQKKILYSV